MAREIDTQMDGREASQFLAWLQHEIRQVK